MKFQGLFMEESKEHLTCLSSLLMRLEKASNSERTGIMDELFRNAHSIKGASGMMDLPGTAEAAHRLENALGIMRSLSMEAFDALRHEAKFLDGLLAGVDRISDCIQIELFSHRTPEPTDIFDAIDETLKKVAPLSSKTGPDSSKSTKSNAGLQPTPSPLVVIQMTVSAQSRMPAMRAFLAYKKIGELAVLVSADPSMDEVKSGRLPEDRTLRLVTAAKEEDVRRVVDSLSEVENVNIVVQAAPPSDVSLQTKSLHAIPASEPHEEGETIGKQTDSPKDLDEEAELKHEPTLRVKTALLDTLLDTVGDFIFSLTRLREDAKTRLEQNAVDGTDLEFGTKDPLLEALDALHREARTLHSQVISARMTPLSSVTDQLRRTVRELVRSSGKEVDFQISGEGTELDHAVLEILVDPLIHLIRNAVDHGLELPAEREAKGKSRRGTLRLTAARKRSHVTVKISDDGRGLSGAHLKAKALSRGIITPKIAETMSDEEAWQLCFVPGLSTRDTVTTVSGRGVGMDVVKSAIEGVGGAVFVRSEPGKGTTWSLSLPYTIAIAHILFVRVGNDTFGLPIANLLHITMVSPRELSRSGDGQTLKFNFQDEVLPVFSLGSLLGLKDDVALSEGRWTRCRGQVGHDSQELISLTKPKLHSPPKKPPSQLDRSLPWKTDASEFSLTTSSQEAEVHTSLENVLMEGWVDDVGHVTLFHDGVRTLDVGNTPIFDAPIHTDGMMMPFVPDDREAISHEKPLIVFQTERGKRLALIADDLCGQQRSILRPLRPPLDSIPCLFGVTLQANGLPAFILNIGRLF